MCDTFFKITLIVNNVYNKDLSCTSGKPKRKKKNLAHGFGKKRMTFMFKTLHDLLVLLDKLY